jgi:hypothetical protein
MSGIIDSTGQQWEHCNHCGDFVEIQKLKTGWSSKWPDYEFVDLCVKCKKLNMEKPSC